MVIPFLFVEVDEVEVDVEIELESLWDHVILMSERLIVIYSTFVFC